MEQPEESPSEEEPPSFSFYDSSAETRKVEGAFLPHWQQSGAILFVTFRLADSIPQIKLRILAKARDEWLAAHPGTLDEAAKKEFYRLFPAKLQKWLDAGYGSGILRVPELRELVENAIHHFAGIRYHLDEYVVASNHVHVLLSPIGGFELRDILHSWKSFSARKIVVYLREHGLPDLNPVWQQESWDHLVRSEASLAKFRRYIAEHRK